MNDVDEESEPSASTHYWLGTFITKDAPSNSAIKKETALVGFYPEGSDGLYSMKVECYRINGMLIGDCELGDVFRGGEKAIDAPDPFLAVREVKDEGEVLGQGNVVGRREISGYGEPERKKDANSTRAPMSLSQYGGIPVIPTRSEEEYDRLAFQEEIQTKKPVSERLKVLLHCVGEAGETLFFEEFAKEISEITVEFVVQAVVEKQGSVEEDGMEVQGWVLPQMNGVEEVYRWTGGSVFPFLNGGLEELYVQAHVTPKPVKRQKATPGKGRGKVKGKKT